MESNWACVRLFISPVYSLKQKESLHWGEVRSPWPEGAAEGPQYRGTLREGEADV